MNSSSDQPNDVPNSASGDVPITPKDEIAEASQVGDGTSPVPPQREAPPLFVPVILPEETTVPENSVPTPPYTPDNQEAIPRIEPKAVSRPQSNLPLVEFSLPADVLYSASVTLELHCADANASIRYALDAEDVGESDSLYNTNAKILLTQNTTVAAQAWVDGQSGPLALARFEISKPSWQKIEPTDQNDPTAHEAHDEATLEGPWRLAAASVRGKLHAHRGAWREDAFRHGLAHAGDGTYSVVIVSDGAGSASLSRVGSNLLCQTALDFLLPALTASAALASDSKVLVERDLPLLRNFLVDSARLALTRLREEADKRTRPLGEFSSTLLILVRREWNGQQLCAALQAGDGGIALWNDDDTLTILGEADHGAQSGETRFLTSNGMEGELPARVKFSIRPNLRATIVMTDGVADDFFPEMTRFPELFGAVLPLFGEQEIPGSGEALLNWIGYERKGSSDDRTLVVCWRSTNPAGHLVTGSEAA